MLCALKTRSVAIFYRDCRPAADPGAVKLISRSKLKRFRQFSVENRREAVIDEFESATESSTGTLVDLI